MRELKSSPVSSPEGRLNIRGFIRYYINRALEEKTDLFDSVFYFLPSRQSYQYNIDHARGECVLAKAWRALHISLSLSP